MGALTGLAALLTAARFPDVDPKAGQGLELKAIAAAVVAASRSPAGAGIYLGVKLLWDGPTESDPARQNEIVETWITRGVDVIAVSVENKEGLSNGASQGKGKGIKIRQPRSSTRIRTSR